MSEGIKAAVSVLQIPCHPNKMKIPTLVLAAVVLITICSAGAAQQSKDSPVEYASARDDARTLLQEADWVEALGWNLTTSMCQWPAVECDNSNASVTAL